MAASSLSKSMLSKLENLKRNSQLKMSQDQIRRLEHIRQGNVTIVEEEEPRPPIFTMKIEDIQVFVDEGEPALFECRVEPKHDLNLSVRWFHDEEELSPDDRIKICHGYGYASLQIHYTYPTDGGLYSCRAMNELGSDNTEARLICRPLPHIRFTTPTNLNGDDELQNIQNTICNYSLPLKYEECQLYNSDERQSPKLLLNMDNFKKVHAGQSVSLQTFVSPVGDPDLKVEWLLNGSPALFKSYYLPSYHHGLLILLITKVYPDDFGEWKVRAWNKFGEIEMTSMVGERASEPNELDLPAWCNKVEKGRLAAECPPEITKHLLDRKVGETDTVKLEVNFIGNPRPEVIWTKDGLELTNSKYMQVTEKHGRSTLILINVNKTMEGEYRMAVVSIHGSDVTVSRISVDQIKADEKLQLFRLADVGLKQLVQYEEDRIIKRKRGKKEREEQIKKIRAKTKHDV